MGILKREIKLEQLLEIVRGNDVFIAIEECVACITNVYHRDAAIVEDGETFDVVAQAGRTESRKWKEICLHYKREPSLDIDGYMVFPLWYQQICCGYFILKDREKVVNIKGILDILSLTLYLYKMINTQDFIKRSDSITGLYTRDVLLDKRPAAGMLGIFCIYDYKGVQECSEKNYLNEQVMLFSKTITEYFGTGYRIGRDCFAVLFQNEELTEGQMIMEEVLDCIRTKGSTISYVGCCGRISDFSSFGICMQSLQDYAKTLSLWKVELYEPLCYERFSFLEEVVETAAVENAETEAKEDLKEIHRKEEEVNIYQSFFELFE